MNTPKLQSHMAHAFGRVPTVSAPRSTFRRDRRHKTTLNAGYLVPIYVDEILPGDTLNINMRIVARLSTPVAPIMDDIHIDTHFFFVPNRLIWDNWTKFCGEQINPGDSTDFLVPILTCPTDGWVHDDLPAYFGLPQNVDNVDINALYTRAYNFVWNECFRDQDLQDSIPFDTDDGPDDPADYVLRRRCKRPDYFTTCRPFVQKGPDVLLPLGDQAPVVGIGVNGLGGSSLGPLSVFETGGGTATYNQYADYNPANGLVANVDQATQMIPKIYADLAGATASTINAIRFAFQLQRKRERDARSGTRYIEKIFAHWGVMNPDYRLQRPEYLGGGSQRMDFQTVANTNLTSTNEADLGAFGVSDGSGHGFIKSFTEYGVVLGLASVRSPLAYQQGINRMFSRRTFDDYFLPVYAGIGEQAVLNKEIFFNNETQDDEVFGYQEYGAEYRYGQSLITGRFNSTDQTPLDFWHLGLDFSSRPVLGDLFIQDDPPLDRVLKVGGNLSPHIILDSLASVKHTREMPVYGVPGLVDHF